MDVIDGAHVATDHLTIPPATAGTQPGKSPNWLETSAPPQPLVKTSAITYSRKPTLFVSLIVNTGPVVPEAVTSFELDRSGNRTLKRPIFVGTPRRLELRNPIVDGQ